MEDPVYLQDEQVLNRMIESEERGLLTDSYFESETQKFNADDRRILANWLRDVTDCERCQPEVFPLTMLIVDNFLAIVKTARHQLQLLGSVCLILATKMRQTQQIGIKNLIYYTQDSISEREIKDWELLVLTTLKWDLNFVTPIDFLDIYIRRLKQQHKKQTKFYSNFISNRAQILNNNNININNNDDDLDDDDDEDDDNIDDYLDDNNNQDSLGCYCNCWCETTETFINNTNQNRLEDEEEDDEEDDDDDDDDSSRDSTSNNISNANNNNNNILDTYTNTHINISNNNININNINIQKRNQIDNFGYNNHLIDNLKNIETIEYLAQQRIYENCCDWRAPLMRPSEIALILLQASIKEFASQQKYINNNTLPHH